jgi:hypothetical protein
MGNQLSITVGTLSQARPGRKSGADREVSGGTRDKQAMAHGEGCERKRDVSSGSVLMGVSRRTNVSGV